MLVLDLLSESSEDIFEVVHLLKTESETYCVTTCDWS